MITCFLELFLPLLLYAFESKTNTKKPKPFNRYRFSICLATSYSCRGRPPTTIGAKELNFRVRYGNGCDLFAIITRLIECLFTQNWINGPLKAIQNLWLSPRSISIRQLHTSPRFHLEPIYLIVFEGSYLLA